MLEKLDVIALGNHAGSEGGINFFDEIEELEELVNDVFSDSDDE